MCAEIVQRTLLCMNIMNISTEVKRMQLVDKRVLILTKSEFNKLSKKARKYIEDNLYLLDDSFCIACENKYDYELWENIKFEIIGYGAIEVVII